MTAIDSPSLRLGKVGPSLVVIAGRPGSGKTTLATALGARIGRPVVSRDEVKRVMLATRGPAYAPTRADNIAANVQFLESIRHELARHDQVIAEAAFQQPIWESVLDSLWPIASIRFVICDLDAASAATRIASRASVDPDFARIHPGPVPTAWIPPNFPVPTLVVDTSNGYQPTLESIIVDFLK